MKTLRNLFLAALLAAFPVQFALADVVESTETDDVFDAVGEVSSTLFVADAGTPITVFVNGTYSGDVFLQREQGSPGSGAWQNVVEVTGAANATVVTATETETDNTSWRLFMSAFTSGDVVAQLTDSPVSPRTFVGDAYVIHEDDFFTNTATIDDAFYVTAENDAGGTVAVVTPTIQEGAVTIITGTGGDDADEVCFSLIDATDDAALVSDGWTAFETNLQASVVTGQYGMLLHDEECVNTQVSPFDVDSNAVTFDTSNQDNSVGLMHSEEADFPLAWIPVCANADAECNNEDEYDTATTIAASTYTRLRVEVQSNGDCYFFVNNNLVYAENECVATTARLIPFIWADTTAADGGDPTVIIDQLKFVMSRPVS